MVGCALIEQSIINVASGGRERQASILCLIGAVLFEQSDEWQTSSRYMMVEAFAQIDKEEIDRILSITMRVA